MKRNSSRLAACAGLVLAALSPVAGTAAAQQPRTIPIEGYAARVNDRVILVSEVMSMVRETEERLRTSVQGDEFKEALAKAYRDAVNTLIERELILAEYADKEGEIPDQAVDDQISRIVAERFGSDRSELLKVLQKEHLSYTEWRKQIEDQLIISIMRRDAVLDKVSLSPNAARRQYEATIDSYRTPAQVKLWMISVDKGTTKEELIQQAARIKDAQARLASGESFAAVARELSDGRQASIGGDWGWLPSSDLRPELAKVVDQLEVGTLSRIVSAGDSLYLLFVEDRHPEKVVPFEEVREDLERELRRAEIARIQDEWTARLRDKHYVHVY